MAGAAIFDLDRTVIPGSLVLDALAVEVDDRSLLGVSVRMATGWLQQRGESRTSAVLSRAATELLGSLSPARLRTMGERAATRTEPLEWVNGALQRHRAAGETTLLASSGPAELCESFAQHAGFDEVIATGLEDGVVDGHFVWGKGKISAVHHWMIDNGRSLKESTAYSDSVFDLPLLDAVGYPIAVNPDARLTATASERGWTIIDVALERAAMPLDLQQLVVPWIRNDFNPFCVVELGALRAPCEGPLLIEFEVDSATSLVEALSVTAALSTAMGRGIYIAVPQWLIDAPVLGSLVAALGAVADSTNRVGRLIEQGHAVVRLSNAAAETLPTCLEPIVIALDRIAPCGDATRPVIRPRIVGSVTSPMAVVKPGCVLEGRSGNNGANAVDDLVG